MSRKVFYSFYYKQDNWRAAKIRNIGKIEGNNPASDNTWETINNLGDKAIQRWIDSQLDGRSCTIVLIGQHTANRKWINYEIAESWRRGKGVMGVYIHHLKDRNENISAKGSNPFDFVKEPNSGLYLSKFVKTYNPPFSESKSVYRYIEENLAYWIEVAIQLRK